MHFLLLIYPVEVSLIKVILNDLCSKTSGSKRALVVGLGALNLFGVIILGVMLKYYYFVMPLHFTVSKIYIDF